MVINEFLPNPTGKDTDGEWVELWNNSAHPVDLTGYRLLDKKDKSYPLTGQLQGGDYLILPYKKTKITINNNDEALYLYDPSDALADKAEFQGTAKEGASLARSGATFIFTGTPTPGEANVFQEIFQAQSDFLLQAPGQTIYHNMPTLQIIFVAVVLAAVLAGFFTLTIKNVYATFSRYPEPLA